MLDYKVVSILYGSEWRTNEQKSGSTIHFFSRSEKKTIEIHWGNDEEGDLEDFQFTGHIEGKRDRKSLRANLPDQLV